MLRTRGKGLPDHDGSAAGVGGDRPFQLTDWLLYRAWRADSHRMRFLSLIQFVQFVEPSGADGIAIRAILFVGHEPVTGLIARAAFFCFHAAW